MTTTEYELTIDGGLGPVLRNALGPDLEARTGTYTTLRAESTSDLASLLAALHARGLRIESVFIVEPPAATL
ncbi:hypothetical protein [Aeromicrobium choanae]|uniref:Uncharacterized protein n=1 Tax=Aeromicrobium choanae TaxID=1736691 RepID=A0A1T4Z9F4_9ACTN|nr:hypothetical protein [Aeromicrobium choanae]SKB10241.1 hypothetical protein SAMN06295964_3196 [Aeromicrobium choanae]